MNNFRLCRNKKCQCNCKCCSENDIYMFLGKYTFDLLCKLDLPCGHPSLKESLCLLIEGNKLPCGHPTLDELLRMALREDNCNCCNCCNKK